MQIIAIISVSTENNPQTSVRLRSFVLDPSVDMTPKRKRITVGAAAFIIISVLIEKGKKKRKHKFWISQFLKTRRSMQLLPDLQNNDDSGLFKKCCRRSAKDFRFLLSLIDQEI